jgi:membrane protease YdiL (CAAX protease family)
MTPRALMKSHPVPSYFAMTFAISWGAILAVVAASGGIPGTRESFARLMPVLIPAMLAGPSVSCLLLTGLVLGRPGYRDLVSRLLRWRVGAAWYAVALLSAPVLMTAMLLLMSLFSPSLMPGIFAVEDKASRLAFGLVAALVAACFEELGWTGFAVPRLLKRHSVLATGIIVGVLWVAWHILVNVILASRTYAGGLSLPLFLGARGVGDLVGQLVAYRVLMVWVYERSGGSLLLAILMHLSLTAGTIILEPLGISGMDLVVYDPLGTGTLWWLVVAALAMARRGEFGRSLSSWPGS